MFKLWSVGVPVLDPISAVQFDKSRVSAESSGGTPYWRWVSHGMPKLGEYRYLLDTVFFLYRTLDDAKRGLNAGGTGFFVSLQSELFPDKACYTYAVSNYHVAVNGFPVIRVNKIDGSFEIFEFEPHEWFFTPGEPDIAVIPIALQSPPLKVAALAAESWCLTSERIRELEIEAADDAFMIGRFIDYDDDGSNVPAMRFGNISMMSARVEQPVPWKYNGSSHVVDMHSRTGFSGSPVFVYRTTGSIFADKDKWVHGHMLKLLGVLWGQFPEEWDLRESSRKSLTQSEIPVLTGKSIKGMSGMSLVVPASAILSLLNKTELVTMRKEQDARISLSMANSPEKQ